MEALFFQFMGVVLLLWMLVWGVNMVRADAKQVRSQVRQGQQKAESWRASHPLISGD